MKIKFWGVRGSIPTPGPSTVKYGGNTACIEVRTNDNRLVIIDAGTGIRELGLSLLGKGSINANIFLSHTHWDHIHGFPFFVPAFIPGNKFVIHGPVNFNERLEDIVAGQMKYSYFPVKLDHMAADISFKELKEGTFTVDGDIQVTAQYLNHPILVLGYRIKADGKVFVCCFDTEPYANLFKEETGSDFLFEEDTAAVSEGADIVDEMNQRVADFVTDADMLVFDAQYTAQEYPSKVGWGHSTIEGAIELGAKSRCKRVALFHHDPVRSDAQLEVLEKFCDEEVKKLGKENELKVFAGREGLEIEL